MININNNGNYKKDKVQTIKNSSQINDQSFKKQNNIINNINISNNSLNVKHNRTNSEINNNSSNSRIFMGLFDIFGKKNINKKWFFYFII